MTLTTEQIKTIVRSLELLGTDRRLDAEADELLTPITSSDELVEIISQVEPSLDAARALYRAARIVGGPSIEHARWLLAGAYSLEGLDDVAHAIEPRQQETGFVKRSFSDYQP